MRDLFLVELKKICSEYQFDKEDIQILAAEAERICKLSYIAREEGLLALIDIVENEIGICEKYEISKLSEMGFDGYLRELIELLTEGTDYEIICSTGELIMCTSNFTSVDYVRYLMDLDGILHIKCGTNPYLVEKIIAAYLPLKAREIYISNQLEKKIREEKSPEELLENRLEALFTSKENADYNNDAFKFFLMLDDKSMQCLNAHIELGQLALALKVMSGELRKRFLTNLCKNQCIQVIDEMKYMGPVRLKDVETAIDKIFRELQKLEDCGEIRITEH